VALQKRRRQTSLCIERQFEQAVLPVAILLLPLLVIVAQQTSLLIEGPQGNTKVIQVQGKNYVVSRPVSADHGRIAALPRESDHFDVPS
jgi:hypothetical protein